MDSQSGTNAARERSKHDRHAFRLNTLLFEFQLLFNSADVALKYDEVEPLADIVGEIVSEYGETNISREQLLTLGEAELRSKEIQRSVRARGSVKFPADVSFEDLLDVVDESIVADVRAVSEPLISSIASTLDGAGGMASNAIAHELIARLQQVGSVMRSGILSNACGSFERHLTRLAYLAGDRRAVGERPLSARNLIELTNERLGAALDKSGELSKVIHSIFTERNSLLHREGRVDSVFQQQMRDNSVTEEDMGAVLDLTDDDLRLKLSYLLGYALRAEFLDWNAIDEERSLLYSTLSFTQIHLLAQEHWATLALVTDETFEEMVPTDIRPTTRVNYLISLKHFVDDEVRAEYEQRVRAWEAPEDDTWQLAKLALLDENDAAVAMLTDKPELLLVLEPINRVFVDLMKDPRLVR